jgi:hypothetical protein
MGPEQVNLAQLWPQWARVDERGLARFVSPKANRWLPLPINHHDLEGHPERNKIIAKSIYEALASLNIRYSLEAYHPSDALQTIRTPPEVLISPRQGTCLDLATLFCGLCLSYELLPLLIVTEQHAFAAVSLKHGIRDWNGYRPERSLFNSSPLSKIEPLRELVSNGSFLPVECTGFAHSAKLEKNSVDGQKRSKGVLAFDQAVDAGKAQLGQTNLSFRFALDLAVAHYGWRIEPNALELLPGAWATNIFRLLSQAPISLSSHLRVLDFERLVEERTIRFVGREFIFLAIDQLVKSADFRSGYILIRGEPGIGKTSLLAQLVKTRGYVHHFNIAPQNIRSAKAFLESVCAQLIIRYQLNHQALPVDSTRDGAFLGQVLEEASKKTGGRPILIIVDALDEAEDTGLGSATNRLYLPPDLPPNVYFIVTSREQMDYRLEVRSRRDIYLRDDDPENLCDIEEYVRNFVAAHLNAISARLRTWNVTEGEFTTLIVEKSQGNFMYLVHVLDDILAGRLSRQTIDRIQDLPQGLLAYYERHWRFMRAHNPDRFEQVYEPVLRLLATVREPVPLSAIGEWTGLEPARVLEVVREWRPFLNSESNESVVLYRVYHASFQDFLAQEGVGLKPSHEAIAQAALKKIPGFFARNKTDSDG